MCYTTVSWHPLFLISQPILFEFSCTWQVSSACCFQNFSLWPWLSTFLSWCVCCRSFCVYLIRIHWAFWMCRMMFWLNWGSFGPVFLIIYFFVFSLFSFMYFYYEYTASLKGILHTVYPLRERSFFLILFFSLFTLHNIYQSISCSLIYISASLKILLNLSGKFFILFTVFLNSRIFVWFFFFQTMSISLLLFTIWWGIVIMPSLNSLHIVIFISWKILITAAFKSLFAKGIFCVLLKPVSIAYIFSYV